MSKIVVVEDDPAISEMLIYHLEGLGYDVIHFADGLSAKEYLMANECDLVLLDIMLPKYNGLDLCSELRQQQAQLPIMLLTSLDSEADRVVGLELGADDYLTKPFSLRECQARIKALLRRSQLPAKKEKSEYSASIQFKELDINEDARFVAVDGNKVELTAKEFDLLLYLAQNKKKVFSRNQLLDSIWGYSHEGYEHTINTHINRLRKKLKRSNGKPDFIQTVWAVGYKFLDED